MSLILKLYQNVLTPQMPEYVAVNSVLTVVTGSVSYGANLADKSDIDLHNVFLPLKEQI